MSGFKEVIKHSGNYLIANLATRALAFISIPIYTRLLSPEDYGTISIFLGITGILSSVLTLCCDQAISRYFFDQKSSEDFKDFIGTSSILAFIIFVINSGVLAIFAGEFGRKVGLDESTVYLIIPVAFINIVGLTFEQIYNPLKKSKEIAIVSLTRVYIGFALSILFILLFKSKKFNGQIVGQIVAGLIMFFFWIRYISPYFKFIFKKVYLKYIFTYSVPLIPYVLSGVIIEQFGKIAIGNTQTVSEAGFYGLALTVGSIVNIVIVVTNQAWVPYYFNYMNTKNYIQLDKDMIRIFKITLIAAIGVSLFGHEIGILLAKKEFLKSIHLVPIFALGYVFYQLAYVYMRNFGYSKKTHFLTLTVLISGLINVFCNMFFINTFGELGVACSFLLSYVIMAFTAWIFNRLFLKLYITSAKCFLVPLLISGPFIFYSFIVSSIENSFFSILFRLILFFLIVCIFFWREKKEITQTLLKILNYKS